MKSLIDKPNGEQGCWLWHGAVTNGYGRLGIHGVTVRVHRLAYELIRGAIPEGLVIDHLCRNRRCVNPWHMDPVSNKENILRGISVSAKNCRKTHCAHGHPFNEENTYIKTTGKRGCRTCHYEQIRAWRQKKKEALRLPA